MSLKHLFPTKNERQINREKLLLMKYANFGSPSEIDQMERASFNDFFIHLKEVNKQEKKAMEKNKKSSNKRLGL